MSKVEFNLDNLKKCLCPACPVQADSTCAKEKLLKMQEMEDKLSNSELVPVLYCASGKTNCTDLDFNQICQCGSCEVWKKNKLEDGEPNFYFCQDGEAR